MREAVWLVRQCAVCLVLPVPSAEGRRCISSAITTQRFQSRSYPYTDHKLCGGGCGLHKGGASDCALDQKPTSAV